MINDRDPGLRGSYPPTAGVRSHPRKTTATSC